MRPVGSKYLLEEPLGRGATGTVWRAQVRDEAGSTVAVKVLKEELAGDPDVVMRFLRERSVLLRLRHPHIVRVRDLVVEGDLLALVMDLVDGPDLHRYLRENGPFTPVAAALLTAAVADALAASHADGVVHRDLKPANVLLATLTGEDGDERMHPMLTDFGIARLADSPGVTRTHEFVGTPAYVAPESAQGRPQTSAVDIYGAGILLYELVTGRVPFQGENAIEVLQAHLNQQPRRPSTVPEPLWTVIERCLRKEPAQRPSADSLARALRVVAAGVGVHATPAAAEAALGVGALLAPDETPTLVPGTGQGAAQGAGGGSGDADPTQVLPHGQSGGSYDPNAATSVLPSEGANRPAADGTRVLPPVPGGQPGGQQSGQQGPHPWESQLSAARQRNDQTEARYLPPEMDPLFRRPRRQPGQPAQPEGQGRPGYGYPQQQYPQQQRQQGGGQGYGYPQQQSGPPQQPRYQQPPQQPAQQQPRYQQPQPQRYEPQQRPPAAPEPPRQHEPRRRSANPVKIPGLGCLKGCLTVILVMVVLFVIVWYTTPLPHWVDSTRNLWDATSSWAHSAWDKLSSITGDSGGGQGDNTPNPLNTPDLNGITGQNGLGGLNGLNGNG
ncbi:serine/threonine-protein kinase [Actinacidiphila bryophytorum]|uniref:non-specific serine/threonine protein kinase n=1 Tax=Actinacidiphila bryophytorum TaxID=1436133 RepID=A0A9W4E503_9ACTN|nr:serine/threonine-protein kinase [Actinacidiphila bryophytorum]MBM9440437.1 serine/threonine protein kinase [Actinacidiphila bryophytorum]MBN6547622.1 serine/threonine protein kinase [Actinacidiphila bryophytorum]CAG7622977.1 Serine/threonine-protein kinase PkaA [Actinacidiphila bryophytorum]